VTRHPQTGAASNFRLTNVNVHGISELGGRSANNGQFPRSRARTYRKQAAKKKNPRLWVVVQQPRGEYA